MFVTANVCLCLPLRAIYQIGTKLGVRVSGSNGVMVSPLDSPETTQVRFRAGDVPQEYGCTTHVVVSILPQGTLNRGDFCVPMHLGSCTNLKEPG